MTFIPEKKDAIYVRGVVIAAGMKDTQGDTAPNKEGIKKIFTNYLKQESDVEHSYISNFNVHQLENTITQTPIKINGQEVPVGSWIASHMVLNPSLIAMIRDKKLNGYSLGAIGDKGLNENITIENNFLNKSLQYTDLKDYEELNPFFISFVNSPSNMFVWEVMDYTQFLSKSANINENVTGDIMSEKQENDEVIKVSVAERLFGALLTKSAEAETDEKVEAAEEKVEEKVEEEQVETEISNKDIMAKLEELPNAISAGVVDAMKQLASESLQTDETALAKSSDAENENVKVEPAEDEEEEASAEEDSKLEKSTESASENETVEKQKMEKSSQKIDEMQTAKKVEPKEKFLGGAKRDEYGRVRKYV